MATASRPNSGSLSTQFIHAVERVRPTVVDQARSEILFLNLAKEMGFQKETDTSFAEINPIIESKDAPVTRISTGFETLPTVAVKGAQGNYVEYANYTAPVAMSAIEELKIHEPYQLVSLAETRSYKAATRVGETLEQDVYWGTNNDSLAIAGLEQAVPPFLATSVSTVANFLTAERWQFRAATNTYHGITRTAFTADDVGGTHWEGNSAYAKNGQDVDALLTIGISSGAPSNGLQIINRFYDVCSWGMDVPDLMISTYPLLEAYQNAGVGTIQYVRTDRNQQKMNLGFGGCGYKAAWWTATEKCKTSGLAGSVSTAGEPNIYFLNTKWIRLDICRRANYVITEWARNAGQLAAAAQILLRLQMIFDQPRTSGVLAGFGL